MVVFGSQETRVQGDAGEIQGFAWRCTEMHGDTGRCMEMQPLRTSPWIISSMDRSDRALRRVAATLTAMSP